MSINCFFIEQYVRKGHAMKIRLTIAALVLSATGAFAGCNTPELELELEKDIGGYSDSTSISFAFTIPLGKANARICDAEISKEVSEAHKSAAKSRETVAKAKEQEQDNLEQKIEICSDFRLDSAPNSIKDFCGDLLQ